MYQAIIIIHVLLGLSIIGLVLMQQGKGADAGAAFGTGASGSVFGAQGAASFLSRTTAIMATLFFSTSLGLAVFNSHRGGSTDIMSGLGGEKVEQTAPKLETPAAVPEVPQQPPVAVPAAAAPIAVSKEPVADVQAPAKTADAPAPVADAKKADKK